jgi:hypothetical protein
MTSILMTRSARRRQHVGQAFELRYVGDGRQEHELVAPRLLVPADLIDDGLWRGEVCCSDLLGERTRERVVVA